MSLQEIFRSAVPPSFNLMILMFEINELNQRNNKGINKAKKLRFNQLDFLLETMFFMSFLLFLKFQSQKLAQGLSL